MSVSFKKILISAINVYVTGSCAHDTTAFAHIPIQTTQIYIYNILDKTQRPPTHTGFNRLMWIVLTLS